MPNLKEYIKEKAFVSDRISTQVRIIAIGLLATSWSLLIGQINMSKDILQCSRVHFILIIILSILTLVFDFLQYTFSYSNIYKKITKMKNENIDEEDYDEDIYYKLSIFCFKSKRLTLLVGVVYFIYCMLKIILT